LGQVLWYIAEVETRQEYYKLLYSDQFRFIDCTMEEITQPEGAKKLLQSLGRSKTPELPSKSNEILRPEKDEFRALIESKVQKLAGFDPAALAAAYVDAGHRLAAAQLKPRKLQLPRRLSARYAVLISVLR
ncbi:MAG: hypothetical protein ACR2OR_11515, partial [Hyphomicrobiales bacterium]